MSQHSLKDLFGVLKGIQKVASEGVRQQETYAKHLWTNSSIRSVFNESLDLNSFRTFGKSVDSQSKPVC